MSINYLSEVLQVYAVNIITALLHSAYNNYSVQCMSPDIIQHMHIAYSLFITKCKLYSCTYMSSNNTAQQNATLTGSQQSFTFTTHIHNCMSIATRSDSMQSYWLQNATSQEPITYT
jgi:hypothetical protein